VNRIIDLRSDSSTDAPRKRRPVALPAGSRPRVTVVVPCYNYEEYLAVCVASALDQTRVEVNVVIVDDKSTDGSLALARSLAAADPRVEVIAHRVNQGPVATFNDGLARADGRYLVRLDADDLLTPGALCRAVALLEAEPEVGLVYGHPVHFSTVTAPSTAKNQVATWTIWPGHAWLERRCRHGWNCITSPEVVMRASVVDQVGGQRERLAYAHDMEMWLRISATSDVAHIEGPDQAFHRDHDRSLTGSNSKLTDLIERGLVFDTLFDDIGSWIPDADRLHWMARRSLAAEALDEACRTYDRSHVQDDPTPYEDFALEIFPAAKSLREWRRLQARRRVGPAVAPYVPHFFGLAASRGVRSRISYRRWQRHGV
jgi:glycosyltransferase involved in cell wall biosynthesis